MIEIARLSRFSFRPSAGDAQRAGPGSARHAGAADCGDHVVPANPHERAAYAGRLKDLAWFRCHPHRCYRIRRSLPFEDKTWGPHDHKEFKFMAVYAAPDRGDYQRHAIRADRRPGRSEEFVRRVFERIDAFDGRGSISISPDDHENYLLEAGELA